MTRRGDQAPKVLEMKFAGANAYSPLLVILFLWRFKGTNPDEQFTALYFSSHVT